MKLIDLAESLSAELMLISEFEKDLLREDEIQQYILSSHPRPQLDFEEDQELTRRIKEVFIYVTNHSAHLLFGWPEGQIDREPSPLQCKTIDDVDLNRNRICDQGQWFRSCLIVHGNSPGLSFNEEEERWYWGLRPLFWFCTTPLKSWWHDPENTLRQPETLPVKTWQEEPTARIVRAELPAESQRAKGKRRTTERNQLIVKKCIELVEINPKMTQSDCARMIAQSGVAGDIQEESIRRIISRLISDKLLSNIFARK